MVMCCILHFICAVNENPKCLRLHYSNPAKANEMTKLQPTMNSRPQYGWMVLSSATEREKVANGDGMKQLHPK